MASTELRKNGVNLKRLSDKMVRFAMAYMIHMNSTQAAIDAGYAKSSAHVRGCLLLKDPRMKALIGKLRREDKEKFEIERWEIIKQLHSGATRSGKGFVNDKGVIHTNLNDLPDEITDAIDGFKQKVRKYTLPDGTDVEEVETELKLMSKASCLDMAMKHKGLFATEEVKHTLALDWDQLYGVSVDPVVDVKALE